LCHRDHDGSVTQILSAYCKLLVKTVYSSIIASCHRQESWQAESESSIIPLI